MFMRRAEAYVSVIPETHLDILEKRSFAHVATLMPDGTPHVTPVWVDHVDGEYVRFNTARGRRKERNIANDPRVGVSVIDPEDPYRFVSVRGEATMTEEGAVDHINELAAAYMGVDEYPNLDDEEGPRVIVHVSADHVATSG
jgi:PPOX class probable F420-dependent enzyme